MQMHQYPDVAIEDVNQRHAQAVAEAIAARSMCVTHKLLSLMKVYTSDSERRLHGATWRVWMETFD